MAKNIIDATDNKIDLDNQYTVLKFSASWCGPCKQLDPIIHKIAEKNHDVIFYNIDIDNNSDLAANYHIMAVPTLIFMKDGEIIKDEKDKEVRLVGFVSEEKLDKIFNEYFN